MHPFHRQATHHQSGTVLITTSTSSFQHTTQYRPPQGQTDQYASSNLRPYTSQSEQYEDILRRYDSMNIATRPSQLHLDTALRNGRDSCYEQEVWDQDAAQILGAHRSDRPRSSRTRSGRHDPCYEEEPSDIDFEVEQEDSPIRRAVVHRETDAESQRVSVMLARPILERQGPQFHIRAFHVICQDFQTGKLSRKYGLHKDSTFLQFLQQHVARSDLHPPDWDTTGVRCGDDPPMSRAAGHSQARRQIRAVSGKRGVRRHDNMVNKVLYGEICPMGFSWQLRRRGYECSGGNHFVPHSEIDQVLMGNRPCGPFIWDYRRLIWALHHELEELDDDD